MISLKNSRSGDRVQMTRTAREERGLKTPVYGTVQRVDRKAGRVIVLRDGQRLNRSYEPSDWSRLIATSAKA